MSDHQSSRALPIGHMQPHRGPMATGKVVPITYGDQRSPRDKLDDLVMVPDLSQVARFLEQRVDVGITWSAAIANYSADDECEHRALPTDPVFPKGCSCWTTTHEQSHHEQGADAA